MCKEYCQFSTQARKQFPPHYFKDFGQLGALGVHDDVIASYLCFLRFKNGPIESTDVRKISTVRNLWWQTKAGIRQALRGSEIPIFCKPRSAEANIKVNRLFSSWMQVDLAHAPAKKYLSEADIEAYCLHVIFELMQSVDFNPVRLLHALVLRVQSGCGAR